MENNVQEYVTFETTTKDGASIEMAVVDEFEYKKQHYVAAAVINDDMINEDELYIYRSILGEDDFSAEQITDLKEYEEIANAYLDMQ